MSSTLLVQHVAKFQGRNSFLIHLRCMQFYGFQKSLGIVFATKDLLNTFLEDLHSKYQQTFNSKFFGGANIKITRPPQSEKNVWITQQPVVICGMNKTSFQSFLEETLVQTKYKNRYSFYYQEHALKQTIHHSNVNSDILQHNTGECTMPTLQSKVLNGG